jgi:hypothetical protein
VQAYESWPLIRSMQDSVGDTIVVLLRPSEPVILTTQHQDTHSPLAMTAVAVEDRLLRYSRKPGRLCNAIGNLCSTSSEEN